MTLINGYFTDSADVKELMISITEVDDKVLVEKFVTGDLQAYEQIVTRYKTRIYHFIYFQINQQQADAEDLTQDVFIELYKQAASYRGESAFSTFLFSVSRHVVLNYFRSNRRRHLSKTESLSQGDLDDMDSHRVEDALIALDNPESDLIDHDLQEQIKTAINRLDTDDRQLLLLTDKEGFSYEQISNILSIKTGTVRSRINTARQRLLQFLKMNRLIKEQGE